MLRRRGARGGLRGWLLRQLATGSRRREADGAERWPRGPFIPGAGHVAAARQLISHFVGRRCNTHGGPRPTRPWPAGVEEERSYDPWKTELFKTGH